VIPARIRIVVTDANILINLMHVCLLDLLWRIPNYEFLVPEHVREEILEPSQKAMLTSSIELGHLKVVPITNFATLKVFSELIAFIGRGEAACISLASEQGWTVASDEKRKFRREALSRLGNDSVIGTQDILVQAIRAGLLTVESADQHKLDLEKRRFTMQFSSFRDLLS
jgi:predicted nucleic acid-binding protein